jgi:hypothetical protein
MDEKKLFETLEGLVSAVRVLRQRMTTVEQRLANLSAVNPSAALGKLREDIDELAHGQQALLQRVERLEASTGSSPDNDSDLETDPLEEDAGPFSEFGDFQEDEQAKRAYLVGNEPKSRKVHLLVKVHDYRGKAIYVYNLLTGGRTQEASSSTRDIDARIARYGQIGHQITHPGDIPYKANQRWVQHARTEARRLGLTVGV